MLHRKKCLGSCYYMGGIRSVDEEFCWSWGALREYTATEFCGPGEYVHFDRAKRSFHASARNEMSLSFKGDWLLMLDCDHEFEPDLLARLVTTAQTRQIECLTGLYTHRHFPYGPVLYGQHEGVHFGIAGPAEECKDVPVFQVGAAGAGCLLIYRRVFERIRAELQQQPFTPIPIPFGEPDAHFGCFSEDRSFFLRLRALRPHIPLYVDYRVESHHLLTRPIGIKDFREDGAVITTIGRDGKAKRPEKDIGNNDAPPVLVTEKVEELDLNTITAWAGNGAP